MKSSLKIILGGCSMLAAVTVAFGQSSVLRPPDGSSSNATSALPGGPPVTGPGLPSEGDRRESIQNQARTLALSGNAQAAEKLLTDQNRSRMGSAAWRMESASRITSLAAAVARSGGKAPATALADSALQHYQQAAQVARNDRERAAAKAGSAHVYEHFKGDVPSAIAAYQAALKLQPNSVALREAVERLVNAEAKLRARIRPAKR